MKLLQLKDTASLIRLSKLLKFKSPETFVKMLFKNPTNIIEKLGALSVDERREIGKQNIFESVVTIRKNVTEESEVFEEGLVVENKTGQIDSKVLSSSWQYYGEFEYTTNEIGTLFLTTKFSAQDYMYPNFPAATWELMKLAIGSHGTGSGTIFWTWNRKYKNTKTARNLRAQFKK